MAYKIKNTAITLTRGDTLVVTISLQYKDGTPYDPTSADSVRFALKSNRMLAGNSEFYDKEPLILKDIPTGTMQLRLDPEDTKNLKFGQYKYDIELIRGDGFVCTFIDNADFVIAPEVY